MLETLTSIFESYLGIVHNVYLTMALLFVFGLLDYRMTLIAKKIRERKHAEFFEWEQFEMNPKWQDTINKGKYDIKHFFLLIGLAIVTIISYGIHEYLFLTWQGAIFTFYFLIIGNHIRRIHLFRIVEKNPEMLSGKIKLSYLFLLQSSKSLIIAFIFILTLVFIFSPSFFTFGAILGALLLFSTISGWIKDQRKPNSEAL